MINSLHSSSDVSILHRKRARHHGSLFSHLRNMDSIYTKENSGTHYAWDMAGTWAVRLRHVIVEPNSQLTMQWSVTWVASQQYATMSYVTSPPPYLPRSATTLPLSQPSNHSAGRRSMHVQRTRMMVPEWTSVREDSGTHHRMHSLMYGFFTRTHPVTVPQRRLQPTGDTSKPRSGNMGNASEK